MCITENIKKTHYLNRAMFAWLLKIQESSFILNEVIGGRNGLSCFENKF